MPNPPIQGLFHPNPGTPYDKLSRRTFLPDNKEGREVLDLLEKAFDASILFTVGKSTINDKDNQIIFNEDIEHKTNVNGGPKVSATLKLPCTSNHFLSALNRSGYPDPEYFDRVKKQLKAKGIE
ncbi:probable E3 ubiquitin-protein ligase DTX3 [Actinia tenebrosa]|uniref:E3 ubiquitin-protein ligase n=1 Tax=Actinia tenebrosa TaxID=6105 RepID=A0A6P8IF86_ACTTE|nr:probable E3 ubiquitin-protein ligase DTX3 [Actinia tenebrosa]